MTRKLKEARLSAEVQSLCRAVCSPTWWLVFLPLTSSVGRDNVAKDALTDSSVLILCGETKLVVVAADAVSVASRGRRSTKDSTAWIISPTPERRIALQLFLERRPSMLIDTYWEITLQTK